jgi:hypothetical protein
MTMDWYLPMWIVQMGVEKSRAPGSGSIVLRERRGMTPQLEV